ncbi:MAG: endonuclease [Acholeplasma sp.]
MKKLSIFITLISILFMSGCSFLEDILEEKSYTVTFDTLGGDNLDSIVIQDFSALNFNTTYIPLYTGHVFLGWYIDSELSISYDQNNLYNKDLILYAKWEVQTFDVVIYNTFTLTSSTRQISYGQTLESITYDIEGLLFEGYKHTIDDRDYLMTDLVVQDLDLYTVFVSASGYHLISFETNTDIDIPNQVLLDSGQAIKPEDPTDETRIFYGWYSDPDFSILYDFESPVTTDIRLYARFIEPTTHAYEIDDAILTFDMHPNATYYQFNVMVEGEVDSVLATTDEPFIDLRPYEDELLIEKHIYVLVVFDSGQSYELFNLYLKFDYTEPIYQEDFESESFEARTNYVNNVTPRNDGPDGFNYHILNGTASSTNPIEGTKSIQLRNNDNTPYLESQFSLENISQISFVAKSFNHHIKLVILDMSDAVVVSSIFEPTSMISTYHLDVGYTGPIRLRFELIPTSDVTSGEQVFIDLIEAYSYLTPRMLVEVIKTVEPDPDLAAIIARFETHRNSLTPPAFNALSTEGILAYYASLNGLSGDAFKLELTNILKTTHKRLISYDEARFILEQSDLVINGDKQYLDGLYSGHEIIPYWDGGATWAREHVWPNSRLGIPRVSGSSKNQGSDVHNLRAINPSVNSSRSNRYFLEGDTFGLVGTEGYYPGDTYKGDVARILFYMLARYPEILSLDDVDITDNAYEPDGAVMGLLSLLILWHNEDPVSQFEINRNEVIFTYQGNRNPFIDNPEYVDAYFN